MYDAFSVPAATELLLGLYDQMLISVRYQRKKKYPIVSDFIENVQYKRFDNKQFIFLSYTHR